MGAKIKYIDTKIKYTDVLNKIKNSVSDSLNKKLNYKFIILEKESIYNLCDAIIEELPNRKDKRIENVCCACGLFAKLYCTIPTDSSMHFYDFVDNALNKCAPEETIQIPDDDTEKLTYIGMLLKAVKIK